MTYYIIMEYTERDEAIDALVLSIIEEIGPNAMDADPFEEEVFLGSTEEYPILTEDEWVIDEVNKLLDPYSYEIVMNEGMGQVILKVY